MHTTKVLYFITKLTCVFRNSHYPPRFSMGNSKSTKLETVTLTMPQKERDLHLAVMANDREGVRALISHGANINYPWSNPAVPSVKDSTTPLLAAVSLNHLEISMVHTIINPSLPNGLVHPYHLDESISNFRGVRYTFIIFILFFI